MMVVTTDAGKCFITILVMKKDMYAKGEFETIIHSLYGVVALGGKGPAKERSPCSLFSVRVEELVEKTWLISSGSTLSCTPVSGIS